MKGYKWMTKDRKAFHDGYQFKFGWNEQDGKKDGKVCCSGGFHITTDSEQWWVTNNAKYHPNDGILCVCYEIYYLKKNILGSDEKGIKLRVSRFKILKKEPKHYRHHNRQYVYKSIRTPTTADGYRYTDTSTAYIDTNSSTTDWGNCTAGNW